MLLLIFNQCLKLVQYYSKNEVPTSLKNNRMQKKEFMVTSGPLPIDSHSVDMTLGHVTGLPDLAKIRRTVV
jgi:hypothetical protein